MKKLLLSTLSVLLLLFVFSMIACDKTTDERDPDGNVVSDGVVFLVIDEESIDNGNPPNSFSETDVNDQLATVGLRQPLKYFTDNVGKEIDLFTGEVGDEGWHALTTIPEAWKSAGPTGNGAQNFLAAGPGLGGGEDDREVLLDKIPDVIPLRAAGLTMLKGQKVLAVVYDGDVSTNYSPINANLMGANLGVVAFEVLEVKERTDASTGSLPRVTVKILGVSDLQNLKINLFKNAPVPESSSVPLDVRPATNAPSIELEEAP
jgi:hypothetical protein